ncbi:hypothetical protein ITE22_18345, partial [Acinetobacter baumannii]|nr:hypothetical protein [Acinetobacter baumannii]
MRKLCIACLIGMAMLSMSGCAVFMAGNQPSKKNLGAVVDKVKYPSNPTVFRAVVLDS